MRWKENDAEEKGLISKQEQHYGKIPSTAKTTNLDAKNVCLTLVVFLLGLLIGWASKDCTCSEKLTAVLDRTNEVEAINSRLLPVLEQANKVAEMNSIRRERLSTLLKTNSILGEKLFPMLETVATDFQGVSVAVQDASSSSALKPKELSIQCGDGEFNPKYLIQTERGVEILDRLDSSAFGNKADFEVMGAFFKKKACRDATMRNPVIFICGANRGQLSFEISEDCPNARVRGFEASPEIYENHLIHNMTEKVTFHHIGVSNKTGKLEYYGDVNKESELGGFHSKGVYGLSLLASVEVQPLLTIVETFSETLLDYVVIDVEGHEIEVVEGMDLAHHCKTYPIFQYELGGTWVDSARSNMRYTQGEFCQYLNDLGFEIFLMGKFERPLLMPMNKEIFDKSCPQRELGKCFVQGNALAMKREYVDEETRNIVDGLVETFLDAEL